jgi:hypothetical protein
MDESRLHAQQSLFGPPSPAEEWDEQSAKHALDELFDATLNYRSRTGFHELVSFVRRFRFYSPFNAFLIHLQRPGAIFAAPPTRWKRDYERTIKPNATPIVILQPMGPVMFVFDVSDTEPLPGAPPLPREIEKPFEITEGKIRGELERTIENAKRDGIRILGEKAGSQAAGSIRWAGNQNVPPLQFYTGKDEKGNPTFQEVKVRYELLVNQDLNREGRYVSIAHELAHLYCGHLGTPNKNWWPDRRGLDKNIAEFEAESAAFLVCSRLGIKNPSETYLFGYLESNERIPNISLECVMKTAGLIESMGQKRLRSRKKE